jgi:hypothetical protein
LYTSSLVLVLVFVLSFIMSKVQAAPSDRNKSIVYRTASTALYLPSAALKKAQDVRHLLSKVFGKIGKLSENSPYSMIALCVLLTFAAAAGKE